MRKDTFQLPLRLPASAEQRTGFLLQWAHQRARKMLNDRLRRLWIETRHLGVLMLLADSPALSQKELIEKLELDKSSVVLILDDLERLRLAKRLPNPSDRRAHRLQITPRGRKRLGAARGIATRLGRSIFAGLNRRERRQLDGALKRIISNCGTLQGKRAS